MTSCSASPLNGLQIELTISLDQIDGFLTRLRVLPIDAAQETRSEILELPDLARSHDLTNYGAAYLGLPKKSNLPLATNNSELRKAASSADVTLVKA